MKKSIIILIIILIWLPTKGAQTSESLGAKLAGRIVLQVENNGEAWYINPKNYNKYFLNRPSDAFIIMKKISTGIQNIDLEKIPIGLFDYNDQDNDDDGLSNRFEYAIGTNPESSDSDNDGFNDKTEISSNHDPLGPGPLSIDNSFAKQHLGKIFLQVENHGETWYVNPVDGKRYFLGRPADAFNVMRKYGLGITNINLNEISSGNIILYQPERPKVYISPDPLAKQSCDACRNIISGAANSIKNGDSNKATQYFIPEMKHAVEYTIDFLDAEGRDKLANILIIAGLTSSNDNEKIYTTPIKFYGEMINIDFHIKKQSDGSWLMTNL